MSVESMLMERPTLRAWLEEYRAIGREYLDALEATGADFAPPYAGAADVRAARSRLRDKGAVFRNGGASIVVGGLSSACAACSTGLGSKTFVLSLRCNRDCYFCFNRNQQEAGELPESDWRAEVAAFAKECGAITHAGLSGGEPLLHRDEAVAFVRHVRAEHSEAHVRIYTAGDFLDEAVLAELRDAGLQELRLSIKLDVLDVDEADALIDEAVARLSLAKRFIPDVMVEMPVVPGTGDAMKRLLEELDRMGAFGINLLEFGYPLHGWEEFHTRGFALKNPPFPVAYDYSYPGGLPVEGSELLCLELLEFAIDRGLSIGLHYCSLDNKNRGQVYRQNAAARLDPLLYELDEEDFFYKVAKVFDGDVEPARERLDAAGASYEWDESDGSLLFHPDWAEELSGLPVLLALSYNVIERTAGACAIRELALELIERETDMEKETMWHIRATTWELLALSLRYPDETLADAVASGEWSEAATELGMRQRDGVDVSSVDLHALRAEATRLFVGAPEPACSPYEGVWRAKADGVQPLLFVNPHSMAVERFMRSCGLGRPEGTNEPLDHVATECEFLKHLALRAAGLPAPEGAPADADLPGGSPEAAYETFLADHARTWMPAFAEALAAESRLPFYQEAAELLKAFVEAE